MKLYKYRPLSNADAETFTRMQQIISKVEVWCSRPDPFNDTEEFSFQCDFTPSQNTIGHLARVLVEFNGYSAAQALNVAFLTVDAGRLEPIAAPIIADIVKDCRTTLGVSCFGETSTNEILWERYAANGNGICVELEVTNGGSQTSIYKVDYVPSRVVPIDLILRSSFDHEAALDCYKLILTTKTNSWLPEQEIRLISSVPDVSLKLKDAQVSRVILGRNVSLESADRIRRIAAECSEPPIVEAHAA